MATTPLRSAQSLVGPARRSWTPEEVARYEMALYHGLASDKKAQRVYLQKVRIVELVRASKQQQVVSQFAGSTETQTETSTGAGGRSSGLSGRPLSAAMEPRARRRKSAAQQVKSVKKLQHKWLQRRCEAAAAKAGGSSPKVLTRVLACCGRFLELLHPEGAERMSRLRQAEAANKQRDHSGLDAMRTALAATSAAVQSTPMDVGGISARHSALAQPSPRSGDAGRAGANAGKQMAQGKAMAAIVRRGLCPGDEQWHSAGKCGWSKPEETSGDDEPEHWPALGPSSGRVVK